PNDRHANAEAARADLDAAFAHSRRIATRTTSATRSRKSTGTLASEDELAPVPPASRRVAVAPEPAFGDTLPPRTHAPTRSSRAWLRPAAAAASLSCAAVLGVALLVPSGEAKPTTPPHEAAVALGEAMQVERAVEPAPRSLDASALVRARRLAESPATRVRALAAFDEALDRDPTLLDDPRVFAEIAVLVRDPYLRGVGLDFVLAHFDRRGGPLLVELLNTTLMPLVPEDRERALAALAGDPDLLALVRECPFAVTCDGNQSLP
ncbi:MAG TPA: hypothetical protein VG755_24290, partial [Nannocystaceae bacterium]|nr:hypothetical protein [Nannocystaceae bacterium]